MGQAGWLAFVVGLTPMVMFFTVNPIHLAVGDFTWWQVMAAPGCHLLLLALFPTDARAIRAVCSAFFSGCCGVAVRRERRKGCWLVFGQGVIFISMKSYW